MSDFTLAPIRLFQGVWEAVVTRTASGDTPPELRVTHLDLPVEAVTLVDGPSDREWILTVDVTADMLSDGVQTVLVEDAATDEPLGRLHLICGEPLDEDLRAEVDLLRAELDMLKRAFRRHCVETA